MSKKRDSIPAFFNSGAKKFLSLRVTSASSAAYSARYVAHAKLVFPFRADQLRDGDGFIFEIRFRQVVHPVTKFRVQQVVGDHRVE